MAILPELHQISADTYPFKSTHQKIKDVAAGVHVCGGNPRRKRIYFTKYTDLVAAFRTMKIDEVSLEHCTLGYDLMELWKQSDFKGNLALGVIDQRSDAIETPEIIRQRLEPALAYFRPNRFLLTSECGFGHVPLDITRKTSHACRYLQGITKVTGSEFEYLSAENLIFDAN